MQQNCQFSISHSCCQEGTVKALKLQTMRFSIKTTMREFLNINIYWPQVCSKIKMSSMEGSSRSFVGLSFFRSQSRLCFLWACCYQWLCRTKDQSFFPIMFLFWFNKFNRKWRNIWMSHHYDTTDVISRLFIPILSHSFNNERWNDWINGIGLLSFSLFIQIVSFTFSFFLLCIHVNLLNIQMNNTF